MSQNDFTRDTKCDVFISYSSRNKNIADALCHFLEEKKIRCWMAPRDILPGQEYAEAIAQAMSKIKIYILVYSSHSLKSQWVNKEANLAVKKEKIIIPFRIEDCPFEGTSMELYFNDVHWIDAVPTPNEAFDKLVVALNALLGRSAASEPTSAPPPTVKPFDGGAVKTLFPPTTPDGGGNYTLNEQKTFSKNQILEIANFQNWLFYCTIITAILYFLILCDSDLIALYLLAAIPHCICVFMLRYLEKTNVLVTILLMFLMLFIPFASFVVFLIEAFRAKKILGAVGIKMSFLRVSQADIENFSRNG